MAIPDQLPIRTLAALTGVSAVTLRAWERRYGLLTPLRTASGHRLYTHEHVERVRRALALVERGVPISRVREALDAPAARPARAHDAWQARIERMAAAVARFDEADLDQAYDEALALHPIEHVTRRLLLPVLQRLGERWDAARGGIAEEHFFAAYLRSKVGARLVQRLRYAEGPRLLAACLPGERHEIGLMLFTLEARAAGMGVVLLGADTPLGELAAAQRGARCGAMVLSATMDDALAAAAKPLAALVRAARVPVFVGGAAAARQRTLVAGAGAVAVGPDADDGVVLIRARLARAALTPTR